MKTIWAPWRYEYLAEPGPRAKGCVFCLALGRKRDRDAYVLSRGARTFALLNLYPYSNGHLMIAPHAHAARLEDVDATTRAEMMEMLVRLQGALRDEYRPDGFNVGLNLGRSAGAGVADHFHMHVVPRWNGDTNYMAVTAGTRVLAESLGATWSKLRRRLRGTAPQAPSIRKRR